MYIISANCGYYPKKSQRGPDKISAPHCPYQKYSKVNAARYFKNKDYSICIFSIMYIIPLQRKNVKKNFTILSRENKLFPEQTLRVLFFPAKADILLHLH